jgi:hypothetical protein
VRRQCKRPISPCRRPRGGRYGNVFVWDDEADQPPVLVVEDVAKERLASSADVS